MAGVIVTRQPVSYDDGQLVNITPPSTGRHQHRSASSACNINRHLPVLDHRHLRLCYYVCYHHLPVHHLRRSFLWIIGVHRRGLLTWITYVDYLHGLPILHLHHIGLTLLRRITLVRGQLN